MSTAESGEQLSLKALRDLCLGVRDLTEHVFHVHMMAEKTQNACAQHIKGFAYAYDWPKLDVAHILSAKTDIEHRLGDVIQKLEQAL